MCTPFTSGHVTISEAGAAPVTFSAGYTFFIARGSRVAIRYDGPVKAIFCTILPPERPPVL